MARKANEEKVQETVVNETSNECCKECSTNQNKEEKVIIAKDKSVMYSVIAVAVGFGFLGFLMGGSFVANNAYNNNPKHTGMSIRTQSGQEVSKDFLGGFVFGYEQGIKDGYNLSNQYYPYPMYSDSGVAMEGSAGGYDPNNMAPSPDIMTEPPVSFTPDMGVPEKTIR